MTDKAISPLRRRSTETPRTRVAPLLEPDHISAADHAAPQHCGIDTHIGLIVLGRRPQDTHIFGEVPLGQSCHHAPRAGAADT